MDAALPTLSAKATVAPPCSKPTGCKCPGVTGIRAVRLSSVIAVYSMPNVSIRVPAQRLFKTAKISSCVMASKDTDPPYLWASFTCSEAMIDITLPDGSVRTYSDGATAMQVAESISRGLSQNALTAKWNGQTVELNEPLAGSGTLVFFTWDQPEGKAAFWHSSAHVLAQALLHFYPNAHLTIGPSIEAGFYYDVDFRGEAFGEGDFVKLEKQMLEFAREKAEFRMRSVTKAEALATNRRLWSVLAADCAADGNSLPQSLRAQIISLSLFVDRHSSAVMRQGAAIDVLVDINRSIMQGLAPVQPAAVPAKP